MLHRVLKVTIVQCCDAELYYIGSYGVDVGWLPCWENVPLQALARSAHHWCLGEMDMARWCRNQLGRTASWTLCWVSAGGSDDWRQRLGCWLVLPVSICWYRFGFLAHQILQERKVQYQGSPVCWDSCETDITVAVLKALLLFLNTSSNK